MHDLSSLNAPQRAAVRHVDGPCLVLAGAGSGKTGVIAHKIARLISDCGYEARQIAALTFTNKAAAEMRQRVASLLEGKASRGLIVSTFHSLGVQILRVEAEHIGLKPRFSILSSDDVRAILQDLCATGDPAVVKGLQFRISLWKNAMLSAYGVENNAQHGDAHHVDTLRAYHAVDFDDLIALPVSLFEAHPEVLYRWQSRLRYLLVDEVQDTNACQYRLLRQLAGTRAARSRSGPARDRRRRRRGVAAAAHGVVEGLARETA